MKRLFAGLLALICLLLSVSCGRESSPGSQATETAVGFTDDTGVRVELASRPQNVAVLFSSLADIWTTSGGTVKITVGESVERGFASADAVLVDSSAGKSIDTETLVAASPDLVIATADLAAQTEAVTQLRSLGIPCALFHVESFSDYLRMLEICCTINGTPERYAQFGTDLADRIGSILENTKESVAGKRILFIRAGSGAGYTKAKKSPDHFVCVMLDEFGTYNIAENATVLLDGLSTEEILREDPDFIFISTMGNEDAAKSYMNGVLSDPVWQSLSAVRQGRCYYLPKELFQFKPNAKWADAYQYLADLLRGSDGNE